MFKKLMFTALIVSVLILAGGSFAEDQDGPVLHKIDGSQQVAPEGRNAVTAGEKSGCIWEYDYCNAYYFFEIPNGYLDAMAGQRFTAPTPSTLETVRICLYEPGSVGTSDVIVYVCRDNAGLPQLTDLYFKRVIPHSAIDWYPGYAELSLAAYNIAVEDDFHVVGYTDMVSDPTGIFAFLSDDGTCGDSRGSVYRDGIWTSLPDAYGIDANFLMEVEICDCCELRGDFDHSAQVDIQDVVGWVNWAFNGDPDGPLCLAELDMDASGQVDVADIVQWVQWSFDGGEGPTPCPAIAK